MRFPSITKARIAAISLLSGVCVLAIAALAQTPLNILTHLTGLPWG